MQIDEILMNGCVSGSQLETYYDLNRCIHGTCLVHEVV